MNEILEQIKQATKNTMVEHLGIEFVECTLDKVVARMAVNHKTMRPGNILHGGATMALAETVGSGLTYINVGDQDFNVFGIEINGNHVGSVAEGGYVEAVAEFVHKGKTTQVVSIQINDQNGDKVSVCRITNIVLPKK
jgi:uncharacterized protein (TIGR00369 family)